MSQSPDTIHSFATFLQQCHAGGLNAELSAALTEIMKRLDERSTQRSTATGKLVLELTFKADSDAGLVEVIPKVHTKLPELPKPKSVFYMCDDGGLSLKNPRQRELPLSVAEVPREVRSVPEARPEVRG